MGLPRPHSDHRRLTGTFAIPSLSTPLSLQRVQFIAHRGSVRTINGATACRSVYWNRCPKASPEIATWVWKLQKAKNKGNILLLLAHFSFSDSTDHPFLLSRFFTSILFPVDNVDQSQVPLPPSAVQCAMGSNTCWLVDSWLTYIEVR